MNRAEMGRRANRELELVSAMHLDGFLLAPFRCWAYEAFLHATDPLVKAQACRWLDVFEFYKDNSTEAVEAFRSMKPLSSIEWSDRTWCSLRRRYR